MIITEEDRDFAAEHSIFLIDINNAPTFEDVFFRINYLMIQNKKLELAVNRLLDDHGLLDI